MDTVQMVLEVSPKDVAQRLVGICGGTAEAMKTLVDGTAGLFGRPTGVLADKLVAITEEIAAMKIRPADAYSFIHRGKTRKGGKPNVMRYL